MKWDISHDLAGIDWLWWFRMNETDNASLVPGNKEQLRIEVPITGLLRHSLANRTS
jgi:hypothetical protein